MSVGRVRTCGHSFRAPACMPCQPYCHRLNLISLRGPCCIRRPGTSAESSAPPPPPRPFLFKGQTARACYPLAPLLPSRRLRHHKPRELADDGTSHAPLPPTPIHIRTWYKCELRSGTQVSDELKDRPDWAAEIGHPGTVAAVRGVRHVCPGSERKGRSTAINQGRLRHRKQEMLAK